MTTRKVSELNANPKNPRTISDASLDRLSKTLYEFGDLGGIVYNRQTERLVGGHQRAKVLPPDAEIHVTKQFSVPSKKGTVALGYVLYRGERFSYREVDWDETREKAANIAANKGAGIWDEKLLSEMLIELDGEGFDLDLTLFDEDERADLLIASREPNFEEGSEDDQGKLDEKKKTVCPHCGEEFLVGGRK